MKEDRPDRKTREQGPPLLDETEARIQAIAARSHRQLYSLEYKLRVLEEAYAEGGSVTATARRHGLSRSCIFAWKRRARNGTLHADLRRDRGAATEKLVLPKGAADPDTHSREAHFIATVHLAWNHDKPFVIPLFTDKQSYMRLIASRKLVETA
jgi:transposase